MATPPTSAAHVIRLTTWEAMSVAETGAETGALADEVEDRALGDRGYASAHLRVDDDPDHADDDDPQQLVAEGRAGLGVEDEVADVDEAADRREDPERDREDVLEAHASSLAIASSSRARRRCSTVEAWPSRFRSALSLLAAEAVCSSFGSSGGAVLALCNDVADFEAAL